MSQVNKSVYWVEGEEGEKEQPFFTERELGTVLAALRYWQREGWRSSGHEIQSIATDDDSFEPLTDEEIDELCQRINC